ncbi:MAG: MT-A70 family methyltransferase [Pirellulaceae bacterium]
MADTLGRADVGLRADRARQRRTVFQDLAELVGTGQRFRTIYADPPWSYRNKSSRAAARLHYATMSLGEICALPVGQLAADNAHLHLWATTPLLEDALRVIAAWGFQYKSCFVWAKDKLGLGNYWRVSHELLLLGVRGKLRFRDRTVPSWLLCPRTVHSRKPEAVRLLIERVSEPPYLELFARREVHAPGWTVFGNQIERRLF